MRMLPFGHLAGRRLRDPEIGKLSAQIAGHGVEFGGTVGVHVQGHRRLFGHLRYLFNIASDIVGSNRLLTGRVRHLAGTAA